MLVMKVIEGMEMISVIESTEAVEEKKSKCVMQ